MDFTLAIPSQLRQLPPMKFLSIAFLLGGLLLNHVMASTITVVPIYEPISLHGTDGDDALSIGEALQASVMSRPMALTGAFPEDLIAAIRSPHQIPTNNPNYKVQEVNLLVLCNVGISADMIDGTLIVRLDVSQFTIPADVDLTSRQILKLAIIAVRKTLDEFQQIQNKAVTVSISIDGTDDAKASLRDLDSKFVVGKDPGTN